MRQREAGLSDSTLERIVEAIRSIRYGIVSIVIQDAKVIQIEKIEKIRLGNQADQTTGGHPRPIARTDQIAGGKGPFEGDFGK